MLDVSSPAAPVKLGGVGLPDEVQGVAVARGYVHLANGDAGLGIFRECLTFSDGFESGDTSAWSVTVP